MKHDHVEIPFHLSKRPRDKRGLPIPFIVFMDKEGQPHFTINDAFATQLVVSSRLCALCGKPLKLGQMWFTGGPTAAFHEHGLFIDPPSHKDCGQYAMQVCPFIAAPNYSKRIEGATLKPGNQAPELVTLESGVDPDRPPYFVHARTFNYTLVDTGQQQMYLQPKRPWKDITFWKEGVQITKEEAAALSAKTKWPVETLMWWPQ